MSRKAAPIGPAVGLTIAGSDSGGGAGIQADLKTMEAHGVFATSVLTAVTAQNTQGVAGSHVLPMEVIEAQYDAVTGDFDVGAVKTGMLATEPVVTFVRERFERLDIPTVVDPVMIAASGDRLLELAAEAAYEDLVATATVVTPNADEAAVLTDIEPTDEASAIAAGEALVAMGAEAALLKGGHVPGDTVRDVLVTDGGHRTIEHPRIETEATHGSGCTLASAITARLAGGDSLETAVHDALAFMERAVRYPLDVGQGPGTVHHLAAIRNRAAMNETAEAVAGAVDRLVEADIGGLVPEVGMNVVGATPYAEATEEVAAVEGRITRTLSGPHPNRGIRFGASSHVARFLLASRELDPSIRFAVNCRFNEAIEAALSVLDGPVSAFDRSEEPPDIETVEGRTMGWGARRAFEAVDATPVAVIDRGAVGKEPIVKLLAADADTLVERTRQVEAALHSRR